MQITFQQSATDIITQPLAEDLTSDNIENVTFELVRFLNQSASFFSSIVVVFFVLLLQKMKVQSNKTCGISQVQF